MDKHNISPEKIPFNRPTPVGNEFDNLQRLFEHRMRLSGNGEFTRGCEILLENTLSVPRAILTSSCTHSLEMSAILLDIQPGDEVIVPSYTFVSTANAFALRGAKIIFADICPDTLNIDEKQLPSLITEKTKAIIPVHYAGVGCEMDTILALANQYGIAVVEDNAHGLYGKYKGRYLGTLGTFSTQSFHETKNIQCGEGGALLINDAQYITRAEIIRDKGTNRAQFFQGEVDKYTWVDIGSSYLMSELQSAYLHAQLEARDRIQKRRQEIWETYDSAFQGWALNLGYQLPIVPPHCEQSYHMYYILLPNLETRQALIAYLLEQGIYSMFHYQPLHLSAMGHQFGGEHSQCPVSEDVSNRLVRLPFYNSLTESEQAYIIEHVKRKLTP